VGELRFLLLGPFQVWRGDARLDSALAGQLPRELLAWLLLERDQFIPSERLIEAFWPHLEPADAANSLQVAVRKLRRALEPALQRGRDSHYLATEPGGYRFLAGDSRVDLDEFAQAAHRGQAALGAGDLPAARAALERARDLYPGEVLSDFPYAEWVFATRERLRESHLHALESLGQVCLRLGLHSEALAVCQQAQGIDPLREVFTRLLMQSQAALGRRAAAIVVFDEFTRLLRRELDVGPAPETQALRDAILAGTFAPAGASPATPPQLPVELPLVGREDALHALGQALRGGRRLVLLSAEAGMGKTRLLTEFVAVSGTTAYWSRARAGDPPFAAALGLFDDFLRREPPVRDLEGLGPLGAPLAQRLPLLRVHWPGCPAYGPLEAVAEQSRMRQATVAALRLAERASTPAVFVLDDLHWADEGTLQVLADLLRRPPSTGLFIATFRSEEVGDPLAGWLAARRASEDPPPDLVLRPLSAANVLDLLRAATGLHDPLPFSRRLHQVTAGHPLFVNEMLRGLLDAGRLYRDDSGRWFGADDGDLDNLPLTPTLREAVLARAEQLDPLAREVLDTAAVLRPRCARPVLAAVVQATAPRLDQALGSLAARRLLLPAGEAALEFGHHLIGEVVYGNLAPSHRRLLHRLAANALVAATPCEPGPMAAQVVAHLGAAATEARVLAQWAVAAGEWARRQSDYRQAQAYFEIAQTQLSQEPAGADERQLALQVYEGLGNTQPILGQSKEGLVWLERALALAITPDDRSRLLLSMARILERDTGEYERSLSLLAQAEALLVGAKLAEPGRMVQIHATRSGICYWQGKYKEGERLGRQAAAEARGLPNEPHAASVLAINLQKLGQLDEAIALYQHNLQLAQAAGDVRGEGIANLNLGNGLGALGQLAESQTAYSRGAEIFERLGDLRGLSICCANSGLRAVEQGELDRAVADSRRAITLAERVSAPYTVALASYQLGMGLALRGRWEEAQQAFERALALARSIAAVVVEAQASLAYGDSFCRARGDWAGARKHAEAALAVGERVSDNACQREGRRLLSVILLQEGQIAAAEAAAYEARQISQAAQQVLSVGRAERLLGQVAAAREAFEAAATHFAASETIFRRCGARIELGQTLLAWADAARGAGDAADTWRPWLLEVRRLFRRAQARPLLDQAQTRLASD
jgi:DNA-binding SARP family transcriptional activator